MVKHGIVTRWLIVALLAIVGSLGLVACSDAETDATPPNEAPPNEPTGPEISNADGRIAFLRAGSPEADSITYTVNPDGSREELFFDGYSENPRWAPTGTEIQVFCCDNDMVAHFFDPDTGELVRELPQPDPDLDTYCGWAWSPDGERIACEVFGVKDQSLNGIYTIRASDGGGLQRITSILPGGDDIPSDFSPDGRRLVFMRWDENGPMGIFVMKLDGSGLHRISPRGVLVDDFDGGVWSPDGSMILFEVYESEEHHAEIWVVSPDGGAPHELPIDPACGGLRTDPNTVGCFDPTWSPDGSQIAFARSNADGEANIYIVNLDGSGLMQVTDGAFDHQPDWGAPPTGA